MIPIRPIVKASARYKDEFMSACTGGGWYLLVNWEVSLTFCLSLNSSSLSWKFSFCSLLSSYRNCWSSPSSLVDFDSIFSRLVVLSYRPSLYSCFHHLLIVWTHISILYPLNSPVTVPSITHQCSHLLRGHEWLDHEFVFDLFVRFHAGLKCNRDFCVLLGSQYAGIRPHAILLWSCRLYLVNHSVISRIR